VHNFGFRCQTVGPKEDRGAESSFKRSNQWPILFPTFTHAEEGLQHFGSAPEVDMARLAEIVRQLTPKPHPNTDICHRPQNCDGIVDSNRDAAS
jgi:hypothetical protein